MKELLSIDTADEHMLLHRGDTVNFAGVVMWKGILNEENVELYRGSNIRRVNQGKVILHVGEINGPNQILVYLPLVTVKYPLALLPGCIIHCLSFHRRLSKSRNFYCTATMRSSLHFIENSALQLFRHQYATTSIEHPPSSITLPFLSRTSLTFEFDNLFDLTTTKSLPFSTHQTHTHTQISLTNTLTLFLL
jgi:hypothetical protein